MEHYLNIFLRTILMYGVILVIFRLMGKREIGELSVLDLVVFIMIGELAVLAIEKYNTRIFPSLFPMVILLFIQITLAIVSMKSSKFRKMIDGTPTIIISRGKIDERAMRKIRYNFNDLLMQLRLNQINNIADVEFAILETTGALSIVKKNAAQLQTYTLPYIVDGTIQEDNLRFRNKSKKWLIEELNNKGYKDISNISFCSYQNGELYVDLKDEK